MRKLTISLLFIGLLSNFCAAQNNIYSWDFYSYLLSNNLHRDAIEWLNNYPDSNNIEITNKINTEKANIFLVTNKTDSANFYYKKIKYITDTLVLYKAICIAFIENDTTAINNYLKNNNTLINNDEYLISYKILKQDTCFSDSLQINDFFKQLTNKYSNYKTKSPFIAALLSAAIPGLGKYYLGYNHQGRSALVFNVILGLVLAESILVPISNVYIGLCIANSSVFYIGNIWGSALSAKKRKTDFYNQINEDISNYYYCKLYP